MYNKTFIDDCLNGDAMLEDLDDYVDYWHEQETGKSLKDFLGLTDYEYSKWGVSEDVIFRDILRCRMDGINFETYESLNDKQRLAARSFDEKAIEKLKSDKNE